MVLFFSLFLSVTDPPLRPACLCLSDTGLQACATIHSFKSDERLEDWRGRKEKGLECCCPEVQACLQLWFCLETGSHLSLAGLDLTL